MFSASRTSTIGYYGVGREFGRREFSAGFSGYLECHILISLHTARIHGRSPLAIIKQQNKWFYVWQKAQ
ncbi:MAG: hypothetical protein ACR2N3_03620 [Pyrinomonadaceae bacterium]